MASVETYVEISHDGLVLYAIFQSHNQFQYATVYE